MSLRPRFSLRTLLLLTLAVAGCVGIWRRWDPWAPGGELTYASGINAAAFSADGTKFRTQNSDGTSIMWNLQTGGFQEVWSGEIEWPWHAAFSDDGSLAAKFCADGGLELWDVENQKKLCLLHQFSKRPRAAAFSADKKWLLVVAGGKIQMQLWNLETKQQKPLPEFHDTGIHSVKFSPDGKRILTNSADYRLRVLDAATGRKICEFGPGKGRWAEYFSTVTRDGSKISGFRERSGIPFAEFSPDGRFVIAPDYDATGYLTRVWNAQNAAEHLVLKTTSAAAAFTSDGTRIVTLNDDAIQVWSSSGKELATIPFTKARALSVAISPDSNRIISTALDVNAQMWTRRRPEQWWGIVWLPEFWIATVCGLGAIASFLHDRRKLKTIGETKSANSV